MIIVNFDRYDLPSSSGSVSSIDVCLPSIEETEKRIKIVCQLSSMIELSYPLAVILPFTVTFPEAIRCNAPAPAAAVSSEQEPPPPLPTVTGVLTAP